ncbi:MAG: RrF2 family transcriptional regulator [Oscillospiraceae bacterium]|nr:RrF2 family transcriptional regulator [Oscillospiraceae bacterium]
MLVSTKGRYALRVMVDLAEHQGDRYIPLKEIAERQEISEKYLETILKVLVQEKMLVGLRGKGGGYKLSRAPEQYTVGSVIRLTEGSLAPVSCLEKNAAPCSRASVCRTLPMWQRFDDVMNEFFDSYTIADLMRSGQDGDDYVI